MRQKSLAKNSIFFVCYKLLNVIFPLITVSYVSQVLLADGVGKVSSAQNIVQYFVLIAALGIPNYGIREIAYDRDNSEKISKLFSELFTINFISTSLCLIAYYFMIFQFHVYQKELKLYLVIGITIFLNYFNVDWFYQGFEEYSYITKRSFVIKIVSLLLLFVFVRNRSDYVSYAFVYLFGIAGNNIINFLNLKKYGVHFSLKEINMTRHFKPVIVLLCTTVAIELYTMVDTTMITFMCKSENVAYYTNSIKIVRLVITLVTAIGGVLLPRLSYYRALGLITECEKIVTKTFNIMLFLLFPCGVGIFLTSDMIVMILFGASFKGAIITLRIASLLIYALGFSNLFGTQVLLTFGGEKKLLMATIVGAIVNIILNNILIRLFQQNGAAIASIASELLVTLITYYYSMKYIKIRLNVQFILKTVISCIVMANIIYIIRQVTHYHIFFLILEIFIGIVVYFILNILLKNEVIEEFKTIVKNKIR